MTGPTQDRHHVVVTLFETFVVCLQGDINIEKLVVLFYLEKIVLRLSKANLNPCCFFSFGWLSAGGFTDFLEYASVVSWSPFIKEPCPTSRVQTHECS